MNKIHWDFLCSDNRCQLYYTVLHLNTSTEHIYSTNIRIEQLISQIESQGIYDRKNNYDVKTLTYTPHTFYKVLSFVHHK